MLVTMSVNQNCMDENTIMIELARSMSILVQMPNYIMVGKNTTMFYGKTLTALDSQRVGSTREWFHCGLMIRPYPDLSEGVRKICEKIDNVNTANGIFTMIEDMIAKFGDALYVYIKWITLDEFTEERVKFHIRPMDERCSVKKEFRVFGEENLVRSPLYRFHRSIAPHGVCNASLSSGKTINLIQQIESSIAINLNQILLDQMATLSNKVSNMKKQQVEMNKTVKDLLITQNNIKAMLDYEYGVTDNRPKAATAATV